MSPRISMPTDHVPAVRRELSRMESKRRWPLNRRGGAEATALRTARVHLGAAMIAATESGSPTVTVDLGDASDLVFAALDRVAEAEDARHTSLNGHTAG
jgi:hypothetical protein